MQSKTTMPSGIERRVNDDGRVTYRVKVRLKGAQPTSATFDRLSDAKRWQINTKAAIQEGRHFNNAQAARHTLSQAIQRYKDTVLALKPNNRRNTELHLNWWSEQIGALLLKDVTAPEIIRLREKLAAGTYAHGKVRKQRSGSTVTRYLAALSHMFSVAMKEWQWVDNNPVTRISKPKPPPGRTRALDAAERKALLDACKASDSPFLHLIVVLALSTGMRSGEIRELRWKRVDLANGWLTLDRTKNGRARSVRLSGLALELMREHAKVREISTDLVFPGRTLLRPIELGKAWATAVKRAGLHDFRFHDLRHTAASMLAMNGATTTELAAVLGHRTLQMVQRYAHIADTHAGAIVEKMNAKLQSELAA